MRGKYNRLDGQTDKIVFFGDENYHPQVSVVMPVYNAEKFLHESVGSILKQKFSDFELILVDDGSKDKSALICDEYARVDCRVKVVHKENGGVSSAKNVGLDIAKGQFLTFCDSDDTYDSDYLEAAYSAMQDSEIDVFVGGLIEEIWQDEKIVKEIPYKISKTKILTPKEISDGISVEFPPAIVVGSCCKMYRLKLINDNKIRHIPLDLGEDYCFIFDLLKFVNRIHFSDKIYYHYRRINSNSLYTKVNKNIYNIVTETFNRREELALYCGCDDATLLRIQKERVINHIASLHKYYANSAQTTKKEKYKLLKDIATDKCIKQVRLSNFSDKQKKLIILLLKCKFYWLVNCIFQLRYRSK